MEKNLIFILMCCDIPFLLYVTGFHCQVQYYFDVLFPLLQVSR